MVKVLIADDHAVFRRGLRDVINESVDLRVGGEATDAREVLARLRSEKFDALVLDISMPGLSGLEILGDIRGEHAELPVLVLSMHSEDHFAMKALRGGAAGYLTKESPPEEVLRAIRKIVTGGRYVTASLAERMTRYVQGGSGHEPLDDLSDREFQVLRLIAQGKKVGEIADELRLSVKTVSTYRVRTLEKLHLHTNVDLARYALRNSLVE